MANTGIVEISTISRKWANNATFCAVAAQMEHSKEKMSYASVRPIENFFGACTFKKWNSYYFPTQIEQCTKGTKNSNFFCNIKFFPQNCSAWIYSVAFFRLFCKKFGSHNECLRSRGCPRRAFGVSKVLMTNVRLPWKCVPLKNGDFSFCASNTQLNLVKSMPYDATNPKVAFGIFQRFI